MADMTEKWKAIPGFEGIYEVSSLGRVKSLARVFYFRRTVPDYIRDGCKNTYGYRVVGLRKNGAQRSYHISRLVLSAFSALPPFPDAQARHLNDDPSDDRLENLAWGTAQENMDDRARNGGVARGSKIGTSKLTEEQVAEIRLRFGQKETKKSLARHFGVSIGTIKFIIRGDTWKHVRPT